MLPRTFSLLEDFQSRLRCARMWTVFFWEKGSISANARGKKTCLFFFFFYNASFTKRQNTLTDEGIEISLLEISRHQVYFCIVLEAIYRSANRARIRVLPFQLRIARPNEPSKTRVCVTGIDRQDRLEYVARIHYLHCETCCTSIAFVVEMANAIAF